MAVTHFVTQFTHVSRNFGHYSRKQKKYLGKTGLKMWSQIYKKNGLCVHKTTFKKSAKKCKKKQKKRKTMKTFKIGC